MSLKDKIKSARPSNELFSCFSMDEKNIGNIMADISYAIMIERKKRGLSQKEFADLLGVSQGMVSRWEGCDYNFTIEKTVSIFSKLGLIVEVKIKDPRRINTQIFQLNPTLFISESCTKYDDTIDIAEAV